MKDKTMTKKEFMDLAKKEYGIDIQKVSFGDVMFLIEKEKARNRR